MSLEPSTWYARNRNFAAHQRPMIRSAALTWAAAKLRVYPPVLTAILVFDTGYILVAWLCWAPNLLVGEALVGRVGPRPKAQPVGA
ncbi:DUF2306 domain-containing protein [Sedimentitalea sp.]|uniref:DUF2306 domain-containing protein n=1 Tax=Sedimentitalea sp. TaxID=2048915 RepID=UPI0032993A8B